jgi:FlaA1/EpsC-like NDP-sugar epimerase
MSKLYSNLINLSGFTKKSLMIFFDSLVVVFSLFLSFSLRLGYIYWPEQEILILILSSPIIAIPFFYFFGLYRSITRYIGFDSMYSIVQAITFYALTWGLLCYMALIQGIPRSVIVINWMICIILVLSSRIYARTFLVLNNKVITNKTNIIIYGAGKMGRELSRSLMESNDFNHIAYVDDDEIIQGKNINNIPIFAYSEIPNLIKNHNITDVLLALPEINSKRKKEIYEELGNLSVRIKTLPSLTEYTGGKLNFSSLFQVDIADLLGREQVMPNKDLLKVKITNKVVMVTGAAGSIGSEIARQVISLKPKVLILFDHSEYALYQIDQELLNLGISDVKVVAALGSVTSRLKIETICNYYKVQTIYHAAAYKHVPLVEFNQAEGIMNNIFGTMMTAEAAIASNVETFVLISTDKAVRPTNTMGATKRIAELVLQGLTKSSSKTVFTMVRFGNVLNSSGSVIPLFRKQIESGGPVTVTDANIVRYFMTITEAVELVIQAGAMGVGGDVFVLDMGSPVKIFDLAKKMIQLSGLRLIDNNNMEGDIEIKYTGLRPGEKLYEELLVGENVSKTQNKLIMRAKEKMIDWKDLEPVLSELRNASLDSNQELIRKLLIRIVPEYKPQSEIVDQLVKK